MSTWPITLSVDKQQSTYSSALITWGIARLLADLFEYIPVNDKRITICDIGSCFHIRISTGFTLSDVPFIPLLRQIRTQKQSAGLQEDAYDYERYRMQEQRHFDALASLKKEGITLAQLPQGSERRQNIEESQLGTEWPILKMINQMGALNVYNEVAATWRGGQIAFADVLQILVDAFATSPNRLSEAEEAWKSLQRLHALSGNSKVTASQVVNPDQGKGANRPKADSLTIRNMDSFWLLEALKFAGCFEAVVHHTIKGRKDRKTYVALPRKLVLANHRNVFPAFQQQFWTATAVKLDILATLRYSATFIAKWEEVHSGVSLHPRPDNYIAGFATAFYKDLGNAVAVLNTSHISLPAWAPPLNDVATAQALRQILRECITIVSQLDERRGEEEALLRAFREFITRRDPQMEAFFDFTGGYATYLMQQMSRQSRVTCTPFSTTTLEDFIMTTDIQRQQPWLPLVQNPGFQNIADALWRSTIQPQRLKASKGERTYEIRYGLVNELKQHARYPAKFLDTLSDFVQSYNQENVRIYEREHKQYRKDITREDLNQLITLIDAYNAETVCRLLIAFGSSRSTRESQDTAPDMQIVNNETDDDIEAEEM
ncbi:hypothetical protein [Dictyobacter formicarum]|uniref:Uncharacterized protein n=1 Tax=Dictyobacter formicarum TaxID=2778368 RepID=A0ABQ3VSM9_9CHLR|nr:hypothetical protein [Dictyobacter formicarum]GHO88882.1 hypothetical protein KSZ_68880 [Dictyobacter formicarum]